MTITSSDNVRSRAAPLLLGVLLLGIAGKLHALPEAPPHEQGFSAERLSRLDHALESYVESDRLAGGVLLVARDGETVYHHAFGHRDREAADPMERDDLFRIASQTKAIVSVAIIILQEQGRLLINDPLHHYLPEFANTTVAVANDDGSYSIEPARRSITLRDLLTHTSGIGYGNGIAADRWQEAGLQGWYLAGRDQGIRDIVRLMAELPAESHPGDRWVYGYNTDILGAVVEVASGQPLDEFLSEQILQPLRMDDTQFFLTREEQNQRLVTVYSASDDGIVRTPDGSRMQSQGDYASGPRKTFSGGAGLVSTAQDYARFLQMLLNGGELDDRRILSPKSVQLMIADHLGDATGFNTGNGFGLGFSLRQDLGSSGTLGSRGEFSWGGAYHSTYWVDPVEELVVVYLTQLIPAGEIDDYEQVRTLIYQAIMDSEVDLDE